MARSKFQAICLVTVIGCTRDERPVPAVAPGKAASPKVAGTQAHGTTMPLAAWPRELALKTLRGEATTLAEFDGKALLVVNVASKCGLTPQYAALEALHDQYAAQGFSVVGFPCNQFAGQEPGTPEQIAEFCSLTYGVSFPMMEKIEVNGAGRHPLYQLLTSVADSDGHQGDIRWNFEKFVISADRSRVDRFAPKTPPDAPAVIAAITAGLPRK